MKSYPSIPYWKAGHFGEPVYVFEKLDGVQIRVKWTRKKGWDGFGSKAQSIDYDTHLSSVRDIFLNIHGEELPRLFKSEFPRIQQITVFGEFWSPSSFVGVIPREAKEKYVTIFDVVLDEDFLLPRDFSKAFSGDCYRYAQCFGRFNYNKQLVEDIGNWEPEQDIFGQAYVPLQLLFEGVVCKGIQRVRGSNQIWQAKCKTYRWLDAVRALKGRKYLLEEVNGDEELANL